MQHQPHTFFSTVKRCMRESSSRGHEGLWYLRRAQVVLYCWVLSNLFTTSRRGFRTDKEGEHEVVKTRKATVISASRYYWKHINKALSGHLDEGNKSHTMKPNIFLAWSLINISTYDAFQLIFSNKFQHFRIELESFNVHAHADTHVTWSGHFELRYVDIIFKLKKKGRGWYWDSSFLFEIYCFRWRSTRFSSQKSPFSRNFSPYRTTISLITAVFCILSRWN